MNANFYKFTKFALRICQFFFPQAIILSVNWVQSRLYFVAELRDKSSGQNGCDCELIYWARIIERLLGPGFVLTSGECSWSSRERMYGKS